MTDRRILVTGANGQLGQSLQNIAHFYSEYNFHFISRDQLDLSHIDSIIEYFQQNKFEIVINCAAYTAVDNAEQQFALADMVNHIAVKTLAEIVKAQKALLIHISTDYVFDGQHYKPYLETDKANPQTSYGSSKLKGEKAIQRVDPRGAIIRTSWLYSEFGHNFVKTMLKLQEERDELNVVYDQVGSPTYALDLAQAIMQIVTTDKLSAQAEIATYHYSSEGICSWYDFAKAIAEISGVQCAINPIETKDYPTPAVRPHYSVLNKKKVKHDYDLTIPYWKDSLKKCLTVLREVKSQ